jgi:hypothetical protein
VFIVEQYSILRHLPVKGRGKMELTTLRPLPALDILSKCLNRHSEPKIADLVHRAPLPRGAAAVK